MSKVKENNDHDDTRRAKDIYDVDKLLYDAIEKEGCRVCFFDVSIKDTPCGRIKLQLFVKDCPKTCENFIQFCNGYRKTPVSRAIGYKGTLFHRIVPGFMIQGGDFVNSDGTGCTSIYNDVPFKDENFIYKHSEPGMLSMANSGPDTNGCQFFITLASAPYLDGKHVVFGKLLDSESMDVIRKLERVPLRTSNNVDETSSPKYPVIIAQCGEL